MFEQILLRPAQEDLIEALVEHDERKPYESRHGYFFTQSLGNPMGRIHQTDPELLAHESDLQALAAAELIQITRHGNRGRIESFAVTGRGEHYARWLKEQRGQTTVLRDIEEAGQVHNVPELAQHVQRIRSTISSDPAQAIGSAKELLETVCLTILGRHGVSNKDDLPTLVKQVRQQLGLESGKTGEVRDRMLNGLTDITNGVAELRNLTGTGHGRSRGLVADPAYARLAVDSVAAITVFFLDVWRRRQADGAQHLEERET